MFRDSSLGREYARRYFLMKGYINLCSGCAAKRNPSGPVTDSAGNGFVPEYVLHRPILIRPQCLSAV